MPKRAVKKAQKRRRQEKAQKYDNYSDSDDSGDRLYPDYNVQNGDGMSDSDDDSFQSQKENARKIFLNFLDLWSSEK